MKLARLIAATVLSLGAALPAFSQGQVVRLGEYDDRPVQDSGGAKIADIYDVVVDTEEGRAAYFVFSVGLKVVPIAVPSPEMTLAPDRVVLAMERGRLQALPALDMAALGPRYKRGRDIIGTTLKDAKGDTLGEVKDLMIDLANGAVASLVIAFDPKVREDKGWVALPRQSVRYDSGAYVATFNLEDMRPEAEARAEQRRIEAAKAAAMTIDRDVRLSQLVGRKFVDPQGKPVAQITDIVADAAGGRILYVAVNMAGGGPSAIAIPAQGLARSGEDIVVPAGAAAFAPPPSSAGGKRLSEVAKKALVDARDKPVGNVRDVVVNLATGRVHYAVAEFEPGWIAPGHLVTIKMPREDGKVELNALMGAMIFEQKAWPDINNPQFIANIDAYLAKP